jgi:hypothetical protein
VSLLLPLMLGSRLMKTRQIDDGIPEFRIGRLLNGCLEVMRLERWFIRGSVSLPVGGSLLLAAC